MLDAIMCPEWEFRYYSFDSQWNDGEMMASMRDGSGDHWFALITPAGVALHGLAHESPAFNFGAPLPGIFDALPEVFRENFLLEPGFDPANSSFCIWRLASDDHWSKGKAQLPPGNDPDGSEELLSVLAGDPQQYVEFAAYYFDRVIDLSDVAAVYRHEPLSNALVQRLNSETEIESRG